MTYKEALEKVIECGLNIEEPSHSEVMEIVKIALEKQIPKKPIKDKLGRFKCINGHNQPTQHYKYCPMCAQLIDWSDTE